MPVYVDELVNHHRRIGRAGPFWCHLIADTPEELHDIAARIGLKADWFQRHSSTPHYDIGSERIRAHAVKLGAIECDRYAFVGHLRRIRSARQARR